MAFVLVVSGFAYLTGVHEGVARADAALSRLSNTFGAAQAALGGLPALAALLGSNASALSQAAAPAGASPAFLDDANAIFYAASNASTSARAASAALQSVSGALGAAVQAGGAVSSGFSLDALVSQVWGVGLATLSLMMIFLVLSACSLLGRKPRAAEAFRLCGCTLLAAVAFAWVLTAALFAFALVGADICVDPAAALLSVLNASAGSGGGDTAYTTTLFLSSPCGTLPPVGAPLLLLVNQVAGEAAVAATLALAAQLPDEGAAAQAAALPFVQPLGSLASVITLLANQSASAAACPPLYSGVWLEVR